MVHVEGREGGVVHVEGRGGGGCGEASANLLLLAAPIKGY